MVNLEKRIFKQTQQVLLQGLLLAYTYLQKKKKKFIVKMKNHHKTYIPPPHPRQMLAPSKRKNKGAAALIESHIGFSALPQTRYDPGRCSRVENSLRTLGNRIEPNRLIGTSQHFSSLHTASSWQRCCLWTMSFSQKFFHSFSWSDLHH